MSLNISFYYALGNMPTLTREVSNVSKNGKKVISTFCEMGAGLSQSGYGVENKQEKQWPNPGLTQAQAEGTPTNIPDGAVAPPAEESAGAVAPPEQQAGGSPSFFREARPAIMEAQSQ